MAPTSSIPGQVTDTTSSGALAVLRGAVPSILPSLLLCDFGNLEREVARLEAAGVRALHLDVMDGQFVPNFTYGLTIVSAIRRLTRLPLDVHLMIANPARFVERFVQAGADLLTIHVEAAGEETGQTLAAIRGLGVPAGLAINPSTPWSRVAPYLDACDLVLVMSVEPGFGGQAFQRVALERLGQLRQRAGRRYLLEVDGGVNEQTIGECVAAGAELLVVGSAIFNHPDYRQRVEHLTSLASCHR